MRGLSLVLLSSVFFAQQVPQPAASQLAGTTKSGSPADWPKQVKAGQVTFTIHQPQIERWDGNRTFGYAAVGATEGKQQNPSYGILWFSAHTLVQRAERTVDLDDFNVESIDFPATEQREESLKKALSANSVKVLRTIPLDQFEAALAAANQHNSAKPLRVNNTPPHIIFETVPSLLVYIDGPPVFRPAGKTSGARNQYPPACRSRRQGEAVPSCFQWLDGIQSHRW